MYVRNNSFVLTVSLFVSDLFPLLFHGSDRYQREREEALRDFRHGRSRVLVTTHFFAMGLDIPEVKHVISYDLPQHIELYVHCIGRAGRLGRKGMATAFFQSNRDGGLARELVKVLADVRREGRREERRLGRGEGERERETDRQTGMEGGVRKKCVNDIVHVC